MIINDIEFTDNTDLSTVSMHSLLDVYNTCMSELGRPTRKSKFKNRKVATAAVESAVRDYREFRKSSAEKPSAEKPSAEKPSAEKTSAEKPSAEKPSAEKPKKSGSRGASVPDHFIVRLLVDKNPKVPGKRSHALFATLEDGMTAEAYRKATKEKGWSDGNAELNYNIRSGYWQAYDPESGEPVELPPTKKSTLRKISMEARAAKKAAKEAEKAAKEAEKAAKKAEAPSAEAPSAEAPSAEAPSAE